MESSSAVFLSQPERVLTRSAAIKVVIFLLLIPLVLGLCFGAYAIYKEAHGGGMVMGLLAVAMLVLTVFLLRREFTRRIYIYPEGIELHESGKSMAIRWQEVSEIGITVQRQQSGGLIGMAITAASDAMSGAKVELDKNSTRVAVRIAGGGQQIKFTKNDKGCVAAFHDACDKVNPRMIEDCYRRVRAGEMVAFGKRVGLSQGGVLFDGKLVPMNQIESLNIDVGSLVARIPGKFFAAGRASLQIVPNVLVLIAVFDMLRGQPIRRPL